MLPLPTRLTVPNGISIGTAVFVQLTAESPCILCSGPSLPLPSKLSLCMGISQSNACTWFLMPTRSPHPKRHVDRFSRFRTTYDAESPYFTMGSPFILKTARSHAEIPSQSNTMLPSAQPSPHPKRHLDRFSRFAGFAIVTDRPTNYATPSATIGCIYVELRCGLKKKLVWPRRLCASELQIVGPDTEKRPTAKRPAPRNTVRPSCMVAAGSRSSSSQFCVSV